MSSVVLRLRKAAEANRNASWAEELDGCEELMEEAANEIERLRAIEYRLPKDAEGNPVTPEVELVSSYYRDIVDFPQRVCEIRAGGWRFYGSSWYDADDPNRKCYGSLEAAEKARQQ